MTPTELPRPVRLSTRETLGRAAVYMVHVSARPGVDYIYAPTTEPERSKVMGRLDGKVAIITGGTGGIGRRTAELSPKRVPRSSSRRAEMTWEPMLW